MQRVHGYDAAAHNWSIAIKVPLGAFELLLGRSCEPSPESVQEQVQGTRFWHR
jgi:hypothetical protein